MSQDPPFAIRGFPPAALAGLVVILLFWQSGMPHRSQTQLAKCKSNCKKIDTALEIYASNNHGNNPPDLRLLSQGNMIATCPAAGCSTDTNYQVHFACVGNNHAKACAGFRASNTNCPQYSSESIPEEHP